MSNKKKSRLSREIAGVLVLSAAVAIFFFVVIDTIATSIVINYIDSKAININEEDLYYMQMWIAGISLIAALTVFIVLFMFFLGQKFQYLEKIIAGVGALRTHRMEHTLPVEGSNEFTELAEAINYLSETERYLKEKERRMTEERESFIRSLSHDIRTPLTMIVSYSQLVGEKGTLSEEELKGYSEMMQKKALQIKNLTDRLLEDADRTGDKIESGRMMMQQLSEEWVAELEDKFECVLDYEECPEFSGIIDVEDFRRIFDNLASNIRKYADNSHRINMKIRGEENMMVIIQDNHVRKADHKVESHKLGLLSVRNIAEEYGGKIEITENKKKFQIKIFISLEFFRIS